MEQPRLSSMLRACLPTGTGDFDWQREYARRQGDLKGGLRLVGSDALTPTNCN